MNADAVGVDASVAVKWVITAEEHSEQAQALLEDSVAASRPMIAPPHFAGEVANAIYQRLRSTDPNKHIGSDHAEAALSAFAALPVAVIARDDLLSRAFGFAAHHDLPSIYDSLYVTLAQQLGVELWIADRRLLAAVADAAP